jgi:hypothetical protein
MYKAFIFILFMIYYSFYVRLYLLCVMKFMKIVNYVKFYLDIIGIVLILVRCRLNLLVNNIYTSLISILHKLVSNS